MKLSEPNSTKVKLIARLEMGACRDVIVEFGEVWSNFVESGYGGPVVTGQENPGEGGRWLQRRGFGAPATEPRSSGRPICR